MEQFRILKITALSFLMFLGLSLKAIENIQVKMDISTCYDMLDILTDMKSGKSIETISAKLDTLLNKEAYNVMFMHYNRDWRPNHLPENIFKRMILSLQFPEKYESGENSRADQMFSKWSIFYNDLSLYKKKLQVLEQYDLIKMIPEAIKEAQVWLPPEMKVQAYNFIVLPHGGSGGFIIGNSTGYDLLQLEENKNEFKALIAHESHHKGLNIPDIELNCQSDSASMAILKMIVGEGTATKFIDNAGGGMVPPITQNGTTGFSYPGLKELWEDYTREEEQIFQHLLDFFVKAYNGKLSNQDFQNEIRNYWLTGIKGRQYFIGSELFGAIYHGLGKEACFVAMRDPRKIFELYNKAIVKRPDILSGCPKISERIVKMALSIGENPID